MQNKIKNEFKSLTDEMKKTAIIPKMKTESTKGEQNLNIETSCLVPLKKPGYVMLRRGYLHILQ